MLKMVSIAVTTILLLAGCSTKEYVYIEPKPFGFEKTEQPKVREIRIYKDDIKLYNEYILYFRNLIDFHNKQIDDYFDSFKQTEKGKDENTGTSN